MSWCSLARGRFLGAALAVAWAPLTVAVSSGPAAGEDAAPPAVRPSETSGSSPSTSGGEDRRTMGRLPANIGRAFVGVFHEDNGVPFELGAVATASVVSLDETVNEALGGPNDFGKALQTAGGAVYSTIVVAGMFTAGRFAHDARFRAMTYDMLDAALVNAAYTGILKVAARRQRPDGSDNKSFPSGHASNAFTLAAVAERHYGWKLGVPAYAVASVVGISRLQQNRHFPSDVVAGATLGYIVGRTVVRVNAVPAAPGRRTTWNVSPIAARGSRGMVLTVSF